MRKKPRTRYYFSNSPWSLFWIAAAMLFFIGASLGVYLVWKVVISLAAAAMFAALAVVLLLFVFSVVRISEDGITYYEAGRRKAAMRWEDILCSGHFYHYLYINKQGKFYYFSRKPIHWKADPLGLMNMPARTGDLILLADQRDLEQVLREYFPRAFR